MGIALCASNQQLEANILEICEHPSIYISPIELFSYYQ